MAAWWTGKRGAVKRELRFVIPIKNWSGRKDSNPRPQPWQSYYGVSPCLLQIIRDDYSL